jgi:hypothetical protein
MAPGKATNRFPSFVGPIFMVIIRAANFSYVLKLRRVIP